MKTKNAVDWVKGNLGGIMQSEIPGAATVGT